MVTPYTTKSGVKIGFLYVPKQPWPSYDMRKIQTALLEKRKPTHWLIELIWRWL